MSLIVVIPALVAVPALAPLWTLVGDQTYSQGTVLGFTIVVVADLVNVFFGWRPWRRPPDDRDRWWER